MAYEIKINPLDLSKDIGIGILLDITSPTGKIFNVSYTTLAQAKTNFLNLLLTNEGERIMQPEFGCNIRKILFERITPNTKSRLDRIIREKTAQWLPYLEIQTLNIDISPDLNSIDFEIIISLKDNKFDTASITFTINLT